MHMISVSKNIMHIQIMHKNGSNIMHIAAPPFSSLSGWLFA
jgi:hypothetical protein